MCDVCRHKQATLYFGILDIVRSKSGRERRVDFFRCGWTKPTNKRTVENLNPKRKKDRLVFDSHTARHPSQHLGFCWGALLFPFFPTSSYSYSPPSFFYFSFSLHHGRIFTRTDACLGLVYVSDRHANDRRRW